MSVVYFMQPAGDPGAWIKIGHSRSLHDRHPWLEAKYRQKLVILGTIPGALAEERKVQGYFGHLRIGRTERFEAGPDLLSFIASGSIDLVADWVKPVRIKPLRPKKPKLGPTRVMAVSSDTLYMIKVVAAITGESIAGCASRILIEAAKAEIERARAFTEMSEST